MDFGGIGAGLVPHFRHGHGTNEGKIHGKRNWF